MGQLPLLSMHLLRIFHIFLFLCLSGIFTQYAAGSDIGEKCTRNSECVTTQFCDVNQVCACKSIPNKLDLRYNGVKKACESLVGSLCTRGNDKGWNCVDEADCKSHPEKFPSTLGICECKPGLFEKNGICGNYEKTLQDMKDKSPRASVFWASGSGCAVKSISTIFYCGIILFLVSPIVWLPQ